MKYNPDIHHRKSIRLKHYDYSQNGAYFVTICTQERACLFGEIINGKMVMNNAGRMVQNVWDGIESHYVGINTDAFIVMPNHFHGIIVIVGSGPRACPDVGDVQPQGVAPTLSFPDVVHRFKTMTTKQYADGVKTQGWRSFRIRFWQRNDHEHIIRHGEDMNRIRQYIINNPLQWESDNENPNNLVRAIRESPLQN